MMGFGKHVWSLLAVAAVMVLACVAVWYCLSGFGGRDVEQEGTLVRMEAPLESGLVPAFVTNPASIVVDEAL